MVVRDPSGNIVEVCYAGTTDNRTLYAYLKNAGGFIGGWQYPHRPGHFRELEASINRGVLYERESDLPTGRGRGSRGPRRREVAA
jgi:hypothetical protein